jgi:hypothetical protein
VLPTNYNGGPGGQGEYICILLVFYYPNQKF